MAEEQQTTALSEAAVDEIEKWLAKFPPDRRQSAVMPALTFVQEENGGYLTEPLMDAIADYLGMPKIAVYEVATFYSMYELKPVGKHKICVCTNISCMLRGSDDIVNHLKNKLGIGFGEITSDKKVSLKEVECLGACRNAPVIQIGDDYHENLNPDKVDEILSRLES